MLGQSEATEGFWVASNSDAVAEYKTCINRIKWTSNLSSVSRTNSEYPLKQYCIKAACNIGKTGTYTSNEMVSYILSRGCRFLDIPCHVNSNLGVVSVASDGGSNPLPLVDAMTTIMNTAFTSDIANNLEPVFIQLRLDDSCKSHHAFIGEAIKRIFGNRLYTTTSGGVTNATAIDGDTKLSQIMGKIIIVMYKSDAISDDKLNSCINMESNSSKLSVHKWLSQARFNSSVSSTTAPEINDDNMTTNVANWSQILLDDYVKENLNSPALILTAGCQIIPQCYYYNTDWGLNLREYEELFNRGGSGFVLLSKMITILEDSKTSVRSDYS